ncbi:CoA-binding protein [Mangrovibacillus cuniculi]|uniref:CoA-binding protein n=1 Tax=Mangrovibacillus cuniculi TaxID=2593652 RepID=A0A7S8CAZ5_9BACI|nr:CoA-binding protein [Mangrovibacillus cuniculi]QPC46483.1 CoA-binding protein [Mangrovibacillus cuniculi]
MKDWTREELGEILRSSKKIAVIGLSDNPTRTSYMVSAAMQQAGYKIIPINPTINTSLGEKAFDHLDDLNDQVDIVNIFRRPEFLQDLLPGILSLKYKPIIWTQLGVVDENFYNELVKNGFQVIMDRCIKVEHSMTKRK